MIFIGCQQTDRDTKIKLENELGMLELNTRGVFDSFQQVYKNSDCYCCCTQHWYVLTDSKRDNYPYADTLSYFVDYFSDTLEEYSLKIFHAVCQDCLGRNPFDYEWQYRQMAYSSWGINAADTGVMNIEDRKFAIASYQVEYENIVSQKFMAYTLVGYQPIRFEFTKTPADSGEFVERAKEILESVQFTKSPTKE